MTPETFLWLGRCSLWVLGGICTLAVFFSPQALWASLVINEFLPDPEGSDGGREFVELLNTGPEVVSLAGVMVQFANGAEGAVWAIRWTGAPGSQLGPGQRFLIVDRNWMSEPAGQAEVFLGLQNGPDAVRLATEQVVLDLVGYGPLTDPDMKEGDPADLGTGLSLSRRPDGHDTDDNHTDFVLAEPTPGGPNFLPFSLQVVAWELDPPSVDRVSQPVGFTLEILNDGIEAFPVGPVLLRFDNGIFPSLLDRLPAGQTRRIIWNLVPRHAGLMALKVSVPLPGESDTLSLHPASLQVGPGDLILNEVLAGPGQGQGEWVELSTSRKGGVDLAGFSLRDEDGLWRPLPDRWLEPEGFLVLAQDSLALASWHRDNYDHGAVTGCTMELAISRQWNLAGWPTLNNNPPAERDFADRLYLSDPAGVVVDHVTIGESGSPVGAQSVSGLSLERLAQAPRNPGASNWALCTALTGSTPGCANSVATTAVMTTEFSVQPRVLDPVTGITTVHFLFTLTGPQAGWELRVFDLNGCLVRDFGGDSLGPGPRDLIWDGRDDRDHHAGTGGYVALLEITDRSGQSLDKKKALVVIR
jgi:hypothetical protein